MLTSKKIYKTLTLALIALASLPSLADGVNLASTRNCMACHAVDKKVVGPSFKEVSARYKSNPPAAQKLVAKILNGGGGSWGAVPMPANTQVSEAEANQLVLWILSQ